MLGGTTGKTEYDCLAYDAVNMKIILAGTSNAVTGLVNVAATPIIIQYDEATGEVDWHRQMIVNASYSDIQPQ